MEFSNFSIFAGGGRSNGTGEPPTGYSFLGHFGHHYNPDQPRVPAGHRDGGQWTRGWGGSADTVPGRPKGPKLGIQVAANDNVVSDAPSEWRPWAQYAANDNRRSDLDDSNDRHRQGVDAAIKDYIARGYSLIHASPVAVDVPGFPTPRFYDFVVQDPATGIFIGVEVKTTLYDMIHLDAAQVAKDVIVVRSGAFARKSRTPIRGVGYTTYCWGCELIPDIRKIALRSALERAKIPFSHGGRPGETLP